MLYKVPPEPDEVISDLVTIIPTIYRGLEAGTDEARAWFLARGRPPEVHHFASTVRCVAKEVLGDAGIMVDIELDDLPNNGLSIAHRHYGIRVRKEAPGGGVPVPGPSRTLQGFYNQSFGFFDEMAEELNLLVLWGLTPEWFLRSPLLLVCPKGPVGEASSDKHWAEPMPNPVYSVKIQPDVTEADDLDITKPEEPTGSTD